LGGTVFAVLSGHPCPDSPFLGVLSWQTCSACPVLLFLSSCPVLRDLFCVSCPARPICLSCFACPVQPLLISMSSSGRPILALPCWLSCSSYPFLLSFPVCPDLAVLFWLS
jgi:hypothetical protein